MKKWPLLFLFSTACLVGAEPEPTARNIQAYLIVGEHQAAVQMAKALLKSTNLDPLSYECSIKAFAAAGKESEMLAAWEKLHAISSESAMKRELIEEMAWGILKNGQRSSSLNTQLLSLIGAAITKDVRAVSFLLHGMHHSCAIIREVAVELATLYGDYPLKDDIIRLYKQEALLNVRTKAIMAFGALHMKEHIPDLMQLVEDARISSQEKLAAITALVGMCDQMDLKDLTKLARCNRAGFRQLCSEVMAHYEMAHTELLEPLIHDSQPDVSCSALKAWGLMRLPITPYIQHLAQKGVNYKVGIFAAWVGLLNEDPSSLESMQRWLSSDNSRARSLAAAAVAAAGPYGIHLAKETLKTTQDLYVKLNLCLGLAYQRESLDEVCPLLEKCLKESEQRWMLHEEGHFSVIEKSRIHHHPTIANYPELMNQKVRLEILNLLAILEYPGSLDAIKSFLEKGKWGVTGLAAEMLLGEGDETAIDLMRSFLDAERQDIRIESALILASWGRDDAAIPVLQEVYPTADRQLKIKILESLGRIGDKEIVPFLLTCFKEPSLTQRVIAAAVTIQVLNN